MTSLLLVQQPGWQQGALPAPLDPEHWLIVLGLLFTKWDSIVVVDRVILEVGHRTIATTGIFLFRQIFT